MKLLDGGITVSTRGVTQTLIYTALSLRGAESGFLLSEKFSLKHRERQKGRAGSD